jgi:hypothetical protein
MKIKDIRYLVEKVLGECYHQGMSVVPSSVGSMKLFCKKCGQPAYNRTFDNRNDLLDLYEKIHENHDWCLFKRFVHLCYHPDEYNGEDFTSWLFCLNKRGYTLLSLFVYYFYRSIENNENH